jgi:hypothetical protein
MEAAMDTEKSYDRWALAILLGEFDALIGRLFADFRNASEPDDQIKGSVDCSVIEFRRHLRNVVLLGDEARGPALQAIVSALQVGALLPMSPKLLGGTIQALKKANTEPARTARKRDAFQEIVARATNELWARQPDLIGEYGDTAKGIFDTVAAEVPQLVRPPKGYENPDLTDPGTQKRFIDLIRHRVKRVKPGG